MKALLLIIVSTVLVYNFVFSRFMGLCPTMGLSARMETSTGMGMAVIAVLAVALLTLRGSLNFIESIAYAFGTSIGFTLCVPRCPVKAISLEA